MSDVDLMFAARGLQLSVSVLMIGSLVFLTSSPVLLKHKPLLILFPLLISFSSFAPRVLSCCLGVPEDPRALPASPTHQQGRPRHTRTNAPFSVHNLCREVNLHVSRRPIASLEWTKKRKPQVMEDVSAAIDETVL